VEEYLFRLAMKVKNLFLHFLQKKIDSHQKAQFGLQSEKSGITGRLNVLISGLILVNETDAVL
jgi:hypothetical protein